MNNFFQNNKFTLHINELPHATKNTATVLDQFRANLPEHIGSTTTFQQLMITRALKF